MHPIVQRYHLYGILIVLAVAGSLCWLKWPTRPHHSNRAKVSPIAQADQQAKQPISSASELTLQQKAALLRDNPVMAKKLQSAYNRLPLSFEKNQGQTDDQVDFISRGKGYSLYVTPTGSLLSLASKDRKTATLRMQVKGANPEAQSEAIHQLEAKVNYLHGNDASKWRTDVQTFEKVRYQDVYPGIDMVYYGNQEKLEYDFVVAPGADPAKVLLGFQGAKKLKIDNEGNLIIKVPGGEVIQHKPVIYQEQNGQRELVAGNYVIKGKDQVSFKLGQYDDSRPLVIDPTLIYSTYFGGSDFDDGIGIAVDPQGNAYITGDTIAFNFPTLNPLQSSKNGGFDAFVAKFSPTGQLLYSTYLGGDEDDTGVSIAVDDSSNIYITGSTGFESDREGGIQPQTGSNNFPVTANAFQTSPGFFGFDVFLTKLNAAGNQLLYSSYYGGGNDSEFAGGLALNGANNVYITGSTRSSDLPTTPGALQTLQSGFRSGYVARFNTASSGTPSLVYSTYLTAVFSVNPNSIAVDSDGSAYITGDTDSFDFPVTSNALQSIQSGGTDAFLSKLNNTGSTLLYSSYYGGSSDETAFKVLVKSNNSVYIVGNTFSSDLPGISPTAFQSSPGGGLDGFITAFTINFTSAAYNFGTYFGGSGFDNINSISVDGANNIYVVGDTDSFDLPLQDPVQSFLSGGTDVLVARFNPTASSLLYSTYLGSFSFDTGLDGALDAANNYYIVGIVGADGFPTKNAFQSNFGDGGSTNGGGDAFVTKLNNAVPQPAISINPATLTFIQPLGSTSAPQTVTIRNVGQADLCIQDILLTNEDYSFNTDCFFGEGQVCLSPQQTCTFTITFNPSIPGPNNGQIVLQTNAGNQVITLLGNPAPANNNGTLGFTSSNFSVSEGGTANVTVSRFGGNLGEVSVRYFTDIGTAVSDDFVPTSGILTFADTDTSTKTFTVQISDDQTVERPETIVVRLVDANGGALLGLSNATITINDNDTAQPGRVQFSNDNYSVREDAGFAPILLTRTGGSNVPVAVNLVVTNGSAIVGQDFGDGSTTVNFGIGVTAQTVNIPIFNDQNSESDETVRLTLTGATGGVVIGGPSAATLTITDNDAPQIPGILQADTQVDFGSVNIGAEAKRTINVRNVGNAPLTFTAPGLTGNGYNISIPPQQLTLGPQQATTFEVRLNPQPGSLGPANGTIVINSNGGTAQVQLLGQSIDTIPPTVQITNPSGGDILRAGNQVTIRFSGTDNDAVSTYVVSFTTSDSTTFASTGGDIARVDGQTREVIWNVPADLETATGRIRIMARDRAGNLTNLAGGQFSIQGRPMDAPLLRTNVTFTAPPTGALMPPTNVRADAQEIRGAQLPPPPSPVLNVRITFDPPPAGQILPPQNVRVNASELNTQAVPNNQLTQASVKRMLERSIQGGPLDVVGYNVYRVAQPDPSQPQPSPDQIVKPENLVVTLDGSVTTFNDSVSTSDSSNYTYSVTSFFGNGQMSGGSQPMGTDLPVVKNPNFRLGTIFLDAAGSFIQTGATLVIDGTESYTLRFDDSGTLFTVNKKEPSGGSGTTIKRVLRRGVPVELTVTNPDGKVSVGVAFTRAGKALRESAEFAVRDSGGVIAGAGMMGGVGGGGVKSTGSSTTNTNTNNNSNGGSNRIVYQGVEPTPQQAGLTLLGFNVYRVPQPSPGQPAPTPEQIVGDPKNLVGSVPAGTLTFTDTVSSSSSPTGNYTYAVTSFFGNGMMSGGSMPANTDLPVIKNLRFQDKTFFFDAAASFINSGDMLIINDADSYRIRFDDSGTLFTVNKTDKGTPSNLTLDKLIVKGTPVRVTVMNPAGKVSVGVTFIR